jgi:PKD repeat protein
MNKNGIKCYLFLCCLMLQAMFAAAQTPRLRIPENGKIISSNEVLLRWSLLNANQFEVQVAEDAGFTLNVQTIGGIGQSHYTLSGLIQGQAYFWKVRSTQPLGNFSPVWQFSVFQPTLIDSCQLWLRADTGVTLDAGLVSTWQDSSPNQLLVSQSNAALQPSLLNNAFNQLPAINFDGTDRFVVPNVNFGDDNTGFIIAKNNPGANPFTRVFMGGYNYNFDFFPDACQIQVGFITTGAHNADTLSQITLLRQPGNSRAFKNGVQTGPTYTNALTTMVPGNLFIGNRNDLARPLFGQICEIIIFNVALGDNERSKIENYLLGKYTPDLFLGNDTLLTQSLCPFSLSASTEFNRFIWSTGDTTAVIQVSNSGTYSLLARDYFGRWHSDSIQVVFPQINQISDATLCVGNSLTWSSNVSPLLNTVWSNGLIAPSLTIDSAGFYSYEISDANGCSLRSDTIEVSIDNFSQVATLGNDTALCEGNLLSILNQTAPLSGVLWSTGVTTEQIPVFSAGTYWVQAINTNNCIMNDTIVVSIGGIAPQVNFSFTTVCEGNAVSFTDLSVPSAGDVISSWEWDFGNNNFSNLQNPSFVFPDSGSFPVSLKTIVNTGCADVFTQWVEVIAIPKADFYMLNICDNSAATFYEIADGYNGLISSWQWDFGDPGSAGNTSVLQLAQHLFSSAGNYNVQLVVENQQGCSDTVIKTISVKPSPIAEITTIDLCERQAGRAIDVSQIPFPWQLLERKWTLWNAGLSSDLAIGLDSLTAGNYPIRLYILASNGCSDTLQQNIDIYPHPQAAYQLISPCLGTETQLLNTSACAGCTVVAQSWTLNQAFAGDSLRQSIALTDTIRQFIGLVVENNFGCTDSLEDSFLPGKKPLALFSIVNPVVGQGDPVLLNNLSEGANQYSWNMGDGTTLQTSEPEYFYTDTGTYTITLTAINNQSCSDTYALGLAVSKQRVNLSIENISYSVDAGGYVRPVLVVRNLGTRLERKFDIEINAALETSLREEWSGLLLPGQAQEYVMKSSFQADTLQQNFFCLRLLSQGNLPDVDESNNEACKAYGFIDSWDIGNIYPNPVVNNFYVPVLCKDPGLFQLELLDAGGKIVFEVMAETSTGLHLVLVSPPPLSSGTYHLRVSRGGEFKSKELIFTKPGE